VPIDISDREVQSLTCPKCGGDYKRVVIFAMSDGDAYSVVSVVCHGHPHEEIWLDATFGSWEEPFGDHVTFSCRVSSAGAGLVDGPVASAGSASYFGRFLKREDALTHQRLSEFWEVVDLVVVEDPEVASVLK